MNNNNNNNKKKQKLEVWLDAMSIREDGDTYFFDVDGNRRFGGTLAIKLPLLGRCRFLFLLEM